MRYTYLFFLVLFIFNQLPAQQPYDQTSSVKAANDFLTTLSSSQETIAHLPLNDISRVQWDNLPFELVTRKGIQIKDLADSQRIIIHQLLRTVLSQQGYQKIMFIIQYDEATHERLKTANNPIFNRYGNLNYWFTIFGDPGKDKIWGWKFEGHHISLNFTYSPGGVTCTPMFTGINPALTQTGPYAGFNIMFEENQFGNQLFNSLSPDLKQKAVVSELPVDADVTTKTGKEPHLKAKLGVNYLEMDAPQQLLVENILKAWVENLAPTLAKEKMQIILAHKKDLYFTWKGTLNSNELHYYALHNDHFIIEFTNRDGGIGHYHTLWRDLSEDFLSK